MKAADIVKKGKPVLKQWQLKPLCSLANNVRQDIPIRKGRTFFLKYFEILACSLQADVLNCFYKIMLTFFS